MHIVDGVLAPEVIAAGSTLAFGGIFLGLRRAKPETLPRMGLMSAAFFTAGLIYIPIGPSSEHLLLNGLAGLTLGWGAFPAYFCALLLQAMILGYGGFTVLAVNTLNIALPAVVAYYLCRRGVQADSPRLAAAWGAAGAALATVLTAGMAGLSLAMSGKEFIAAAQLLLVAHIPVMVVEALIGAAAVTLARQVKPDLLASYRVPAA